ncbi:MAG TPA: lysine--tRNA ligase [bacterium]|jgi:lysyl-tRNA synthetase class 2|nr:MAG: Lysine--tRNA ligase [Parcubacteria group bacterium ADurb.Bin115]HNU81486.1 lysine--tRNA ligase [bacterium]HOD86974.1 lysine--tRNA ligase [bacterium]HPW05633.1 lysine--tRNA ligase [bacterium]HQL34601.1 lysine--tRNA ligase [bacterium]
MSAEKNLAPGSEREERLKKLEALKAAGINPYPAKSQRNYSIAQIFSDMEKLEANQTKVIIAGRLREVRGHGNLTFAHLEDASGRIQLAFSQKELGHESYKRLVKLIDSGDFLETAGTIFVTHSGEKSLMVSDWKVLSKAIAPIPNAWYGLKDEDERYRHRYLDILLNPEIKDIFYKKAKFWEVTRDFMKRHGFLEVETPTLETTTGGAEANPFRTHHDDFDLDVFLRISVGELWQKRLMAAGFEKVFEIGRVYRNEGSSPDHLQEFTNMEFYWAYANYEMGMKLTQELYQEIALKVFGRTKFSTKGMEYDLAGDWPKLDYRETVLEKTGIDILKASEEEIKSKLDELQVKYEGNNRERLMDTLWKYCRKSMAGPVFLVNHPKLVSPLSKAKPENPELTERFQIIIAGSEVGNGFSELNDPIDQRQRFELQQKLIDRGDKEAMMPDWEFVEMLEHGMPPTCGFGFGERLFAFMVDKPVRETTLFPLMRPKREEMEKKDSPLKKNK